MRLMQIVQASERNAAFPSSYVRKVAYSAIVDEIRRQVGIVFNEEQ